ncbi:MAG: hypothetical protein LAT80_10090 [Balneolaceae bacterium]|nr:hypothetical protein [Balneolaceae bacterium]
MLQTLKNYAISLFAFTLGRLFYWYGLLRYGKVMPPGKVINVDPSTIVKSLEFTFFIRKRLFYCSGLILGGDWDQTNYTVYKLHSGLFQSFIDRYNRNIPFHESKRFKENRSAEYYENRYTPIYESIKKEGFSIKRGVLDTVDKFTVCIGRNGEVFFLTGKHRLAIALSLGDGFKIPAFVCCRHKIWQEFRDHIWDLKKRGEITDDEIVQMDHPDLMDLVDQSYSDAEIKNRMFSRKQEI